MPDHIPNGLQIFEDDCHELIRRSRSILLAVTGGDCGRPGCPLLPAMTHSYERAWIGFLWGSVLLLITYLALLFVVAFL
jgi:hypothetical protein